MRILIYKHITLFSLLLMMLFNYSHAQSFKNKYLKGVEYFKNGNIDSAIINLDFIVSNYKINDSENKHIYIESLCELSEIFNKQGNYPKAKEVLEKLEAMSLSDISQKYYLRYLKSRVFYQIQIFDYEKAWDNNQIIIEILLSDSSNQCSIANEYNTNGEICRRLEMKETSILWYKKAYQVKRKCGDTTSVSYAGIFNNLALLYTGKDTATKFLKISYSVLERIKNKEPRYFSNVSLNLAVNSFYYLHDTSLALSLTNDLVLNYRKYMSSENLETLFLLQSNLYASIGQDSISANSLRVYLFLRRKNIIDWCKLSKSEVESILDINLNSEEELAANLLNKLIKSDSASVVKYELTNHFYNLISLKKSIILRRNVSARTYFTKSSDNSIQELYSQLLEKTKLLSNLNRNINIDISHNTKLKNEVDSIENILILKSNYYENLLVFLNTKTKDILTKLQKNEASIEFYEFNNSYYGLILTNALIYPRIVKLFDTKEIEPIFEKSKSANNIDFLNNLYDFRNSKNELYRLIWGNIDTFLKGIDKIYISQYGLLHNLNLSALPIDENQRLYDKYKIHFVSSNTDILLKKDLLLSSSTINKAWLFGGIDYDKNNYLESNLKLDNKFDPSFVTNEKTRSQKEYWSYLRNTLFEASFVDSLCKINGIQTRFLNGANASKYIFNNISGESKPYLLHLATHAYFSPYFDKQLIDSNYINSKKNSIIMSHEPLLRTGLIFSGANKKWGNSNYNNDNNDDGVLTALEVSNLDLEQAELVVMSACETGLGEIIGIEGVYGLQRAFKLAGAKNIIMSLWKVPDEQTKELMRIFYQKCFNGLSVSEALRTAQMEMSKKYPPYYWAAFKLLE